MPNEFFIRWSLDEHTRPTQTNLTLIRERGSHAAGDRGVQISVGKNDVGIFAAKLERDFLEKRRAGFGDFATGDRAARE